MERSLLSLLALSLLSTPALAQDQAVEGKAAEATATAKAEPKTVKLVRFSGIYMDLPEQALDIGSLLGGGGGGQPKPFYEMMRRLTKLAGDDESDTVLFDLTRGFGLNMPQTTEVARAIEKIRAGGKRCIAYLENANRVQYLLASQCDEVLMADMGSLDVGAPAMNTLFMRDALDLLGVKMDVIRCGDFKGAVEPYLLPRMSDHLRAHYVDMLTSINDANVDRMAKGRGLDRNGVREAQELRMLSADQALRHGLVDRLVPLRGAKATLETFLAADIELESALGREKKKKSFNLMAMMQNMMKPADEVEVDEDKTIAILHLAGTIVDGHSAQAGSIVSGPTVSTIHNIAKNDNINGVVVRINSPGGSATASEAILLALKDLAAQKPVVCSMGNLAASGGYYVTCFGRPILAEAGTITGSIGVFGMKPEAGALMRRIGVHQELVALDDAASLDAIDRPWTDDQRDRMQDHVNEIYDRFLDHVAQSRDLDRQVVEGIAGGRVWSGGQAVANKLVDGIGGLEDAVAIVLDEVQLSRDEVELVHLPNPRNAFESLASQMMMEIRGLGLDLSPAVLKQVGGFEALWNVVHQSLCRDRHIAQTWMVLPVALDLR